VVKIWAVGPLEMPLLVVDQIVAVQNNLAAIPENHADKSRYYAD